MTQSAVRSINVDGLKLECQFDQKNHPIVTANDHSIRKIDTLVKKNPNLLESKNLKKLAFLINYLSRGNEYHFIDNVKKFKENYLERIEFEKNTFDYLPRRLLDHGVFAVSVMHAPKIKDGELVFYVADESGIPFCVRCPYPIIPGKHASVRYLLLPYK